MFASRGWMRFALILNLAGTALLFFSFQATSSNVRIVVAPDKSTTLCIDDVLLAGVLSDGRWEIGGKCQNVPNSRAIAVVNIEHPILVTIGFLTLVLGFVLQLFSIPSSKTVSQMRRELKQAEKAEKLRKKAAL